MAMLPKDEKLNTHNIFSGLCIDSLNWSTKTEIELSKTSSTYARLTKI